MKIASGGAVLFAIAALAAIAAGTALVCPEGACRIPGLDVRGLALVQGWRSAWLDPASIVTTGLGSLYLLLPVTLLLAWRARRSGAGASAAFVPAALAGAAIIAHLAKLAIDRPRPDLFPALIAMPQDASFPSAHAMQVTAFVAAWLLHPGRIPGPGEALAGITLVAAVGLSRVYLQVHFPSDVIFGIAIALLWVMAMRCLPVWQKGTP